MTRQAHRLRGRFFWDATGTKFQVHARSVCVAPCSIHSPSRHHMRRWPLVLRYDRGFLGERICPHGIGHPDPDSAEFLKDRDPNSYAGGIHGCDGCCVSPERRVAPVAGT